MSTGLPFPWKWIPLAALLVVWRVLTLTQWIQAFQTRVAEAGLEKSGVQYRR